MDAQRDAVAIKRFNGQNFHLWSFQMKALFLGRELMGVVDGLVAKPAETSLVEREEWIKKDGQGISLLCAALDESMLDLVCGCITSHEIWEKLKMIHDQ